jgi:hypothetical protein
VKNGPGEKQKMTTITLRAHFDGEKILLREPLALPPNIDLLITLHTLPDTEQSDWQQLAVEGLSAAYAEDEPDYPAALTKDGVR